MNTLESIALFFLPTSFCRLLFCLFGVKSVQLGVRSKIGFSWIKCRKLIVGDGANIGHLNVIRINKMEIGDGKIRHLNMIKGYLSVRLEGNAWINSQNKITAPAKSQRTWHEPQFILKTGAQVIMHHLFDVTDDIVIGERVTLAGDGTQIWSHAFFLGSQKHVRVDGSVHIGNDCYIGARCVICAGVIIADHVALGAGTVVSKSLLEPGLYVSQPLRYIKYDADESIRKMEEAGIKRAEGVYEKMK